MNMRETCPHCGGPARIRTSRRITALTREAYVQCENIECCHVWRILISSVSTVVPSLKPNPDVFLPASRKARGEGGDERQPGLFNDAGQ
jgi:ssDNA-binding Zn-finger/Zn-ribbon topoisomerase 1